MITIDSKAALKRIPVGTKLRLVRSLLGPCNKLRELHAVRSADLVFKVLDVGDKKYGQLSYLSFADTRLESRPNGFALYEKEDSGLGITGPCAEYEWVNS